MVRTPSLALSRSVHSPPAPLGVHMDPVRSIAITMSRGEAEHGLHALACAVMSKWSMPNNPANQVGVLAAPDTWSAFGFTAGSQPVAITAVFVQRVWYVNVKFERLEGVLAAAYDVAVAIAVAAVGRSWAPASAAASVALCSWRLA